MTNFGIRPELKQRVYDNEYKQMKLFEAALSEDERKQLGMEVTTIGGYRVMVNPGIPGNFPSKVPGNLDEGVFDHLDDILQWYRERNSFCAIGHIPDNNNLPVVRRLMNSGFEIGDYMSYWVLKLEDNHRSLEVSEKVREVKPDEGLLFAKIGMEGFGIAEEGELGKNFRILLDVSTRIDQGICVFYEDEGQPVGTGSVFAVDNDPFMFNGSVLKDYRGKRIQQELIKYRVRWAAEQGSEYVFVNTALNSTSGRNLQRLGFRNAFTAIHLVYKFDQEE